MLFLSADRYGRLTLSTHLQRADSCLQKKILPRCFGAVIHPALACYPIDVYRRYRRSLAGRVFLCGRVCLATSAHGSRWPIEAAMIPLGEVTCNHLRESSGAQFDSLCYSTSSTELAYCNIFRWSRNIRRRGGNVSRQLSRTFDSLHKGTCDRKCRSP